MPACHNALRLLCPSGAADFSTHHIACEELTTMDSPNRATDLRVLLIDSCRPYRDGLRQGLVRGKSLVVAGVADTAEQVRAPGFSLDVDVAVVDIDLPDQGGIDLCRWLVEQRPGIAVLMVSFWDWDVYLAASYAAGAWGFLLRSAVTREISTAVRRAVEGPFYTDDQMARLAQWQRAVGPQLATLGAREWEVFWLLASGCSNRDIARQLGLSENTAEKHVSTILHKLCLPSRTALLAYILRHHLDALVRLPYDTNPLAGGS
jgi:DNA-binding NarL/FixJ family response regulator